MPAGRIREICLEALFTPQRPENLMVFLPQSGALRLLASKDQSSQQAALLQGQVFLNAQPITIWLNGAGPQLAANGHADDTSVSAQSDPAQAAVEIVPPANDSEPRQSTTSTAMSPSKPKGPPALPTRDTSTQALSSLQVSNQQLVDQIVKELESQAHFVSYAPPKFIAFRQGIYLELSLNTALPESAAGSRYKLAAMAFDDHIAHLIRPVLAYFKDEQQFDGIGFSTTVHVPGKSAAAAATEAVEFFFPNCLCALLREVRLHRATASRHRNSLDQWRASGSRPGNCRGRLQPLKSCICAVVSSILVSRL